MNPQKPKHIKEAQGTLKNYREIANPAMGESLSVLPAVPDGFTVEEEKFFIYVCNELLNLGLLASQFIVDVEMACIWYRAFCEARKVIREGGGVQTTQSGYNQTTGYWSQMKDSYKNLVDFNNKYGLNLVAAQKISMPDILKESDIFK